LPKNSIDNHYSINPFLGFLAMFVTQDIALKLFFSEIKIRNKSFSVPKNSSIILAPTHRSRWDGLVLTKAMGRRVNNKDCRFMVTKSEMKGIQGWFLKRLGCFSIDQISPSLSILRHAVNLIEKKEQLVVFPEGKINKYGKKLILKEGLYRLALLAAKKTSTIFIIPIGIAYDQVSPKFRGKVALSFGQPLLVNKKPNLSIKEFNEILNKRMQYAEKSALENVGR
jgi:1-acyl-sn-glycerol-3-phosphate acyltransferase